MKGPKEEHLGLELNTERQMDGKRLRTLVMSIFAMLVGIAILIALWLNFQVLSAEPGQLSQSDIEAKAIAYAQGRGLKGAPTGIQSKQITLAEFNARLSPFSHDPTPGDTLFWLVILKGDVSIQLIPDMQGKPNYAGFDNMWVLLTPRGDVKGMGARPSCNELDLSKPPTPITSFPTSPCPN